MRIVITIVEQKRLHVPGSMVILFFYITKEGDTSGAGQER